MKKSQVTISFSYDVANTTTVSIDDSVAREIHAIESASEGIKVMRDQLVQFVEDNREALSVEAIAATLKANGYSKQRISGLLLAYGIKRRAASKSKADASAEVDALVEKAKPALLELCGGDEKLFRAVVNRMFRSK